MWIDDKYVVPSHVSAVVPRNQKRHRNGTVTSNGSIIYLDSGGVIYTGWPTTQVVAVLGLTNR